MAAEEPMPEKKLIDPINRYVYIARADGRVDVTDPDTGKTGIFDDKGVWHSGELTYANRQLLGWIGRLAVRRATPGGDS
ncbi:transposase [Sporichthya sp.]|uniref:transposase n=1 Tax=Sporichthya sp. TaxID=65475 RepID=UPI0025F5AF0B|nr:transposase [Sporichthya sp.]